MKKAMVISVGTGIGVESGITASINQNNPDFIIFLVTEESKHTIARVEEFRKQKFVPEEYTTEIIKNENDAEECYELSKKVIKKLKENGFDNISVDFTSGTKAMTSGVVLAAVEEEMPSLVYVMGKRDEKTGRVITGTERIFTIPSPIRILSNMKKKDIMRMFNRYQFDECLRVVEDVKSKTKDENILRDFYILEKLAKGYSYWDKFNHKEALATLRDHDNSLLNIEENKKILLNIEKDENLRIADLLNNGMRRIEEGKYDDAIARLYRTIELLGQTILKMHNISTTDLDTWQLKVLGLAEEIINEYEKYKDTKGKIKLPLNATMKLLADLDKLGKNYKYVEIGTKFFADSELQDLLNKRNNSILAHGLEPVERSIAERLFKKVKEYTNLVVKDLDNLMEKSKFPKFLII